MVAPEFTEQDRMAIEAAYKVKVGDEVQFNVVVVDEIPLTVRGKSKMLDSRLNTIIDALIHGTKENHDSASERDHKQKV